MRHWILLQTLQFLTRLPIRQDGVEKRDKVYSASPFMRVIKCTYVILTLRGI